MDCVNRWLPHVYAASASGNLEPPPEPKIPAEYLQKPRRHPAPTRACAHKTHLASPPPSISICTSTCACLAPSKRRRTALSKIDSPHQKRKRQRVAHVMSQNSQSPTRKSSRQSRTIMKEAPLVGMDIDFGTQHLIDANATPRPTRRKRVAPVSLPVPDLQQARPVPVLMPIPMPRSASEEQEQADDDTEVESTHESTTSKRSRSPTRRMVDLHIAKKPIVSKTAKSSTDVPDDVKTLYKAIQALARRSKGVIPLGIEAEVQQDSNGDLDDLDDYVAKTPNAKTHEELIDQFKAMRDIRNETSTCKTKHLHEPSWNELVHSQMLKQAVLCLDGFSYYNITTARVIRELVPGNEYGELLKGKMIDFAVTLAPPLIPTANIINRLSASPRKLQRTCNPSDYSPLCYEPVVLSIETKSPDGGGENGEVQLSVWAMAHFNRLRQLIQDPVSKTLPLLLIADARWKLYFASDLANEIHLIDAVDIGTTADIIGCYTILEALRVIFQWVKETYVPWFNEGLNPE